MGSEMCIRDRGDLGVVGREQEQGGQILQLGQVGIVPVTSTQWMLAYLVSNLTQNYRKKSRRRQKEY